MPTVGEDYQSKKNYTFLLRDPSGEPVDFGLVIGKYGWVCNICGLPVDPIYAWPHPFSKSWDHVIPIARGGRHEQDNVRLTHLRCNLWKNDRLISELPEVDLDYLALPQHSGEATTVGQFMRLMRIENPELTKEVCGKYPVKSNVKRDRRSKEVDATFSDEEDATLSPSVQRQVDRAIYLQWMSEQWD